MNLGLPLIAFVTCGGIGFALGSSFDAIENSPNQNTDGNETPATSNSQLVAPCGGVAGQADTAAFSDSSFHNRRHKPGGLQDHA